MASYRVTEDGGWVEVDPETEQPIRLKRDSVPGAPGDQAAPVTTLVEIAPYSEPHPVNVQVTPHVHTAPAQQRVTLRTSYADRAKGFNSKVRVPALLTGAVSGVVAWHFAAVPLISGTMLLVLVGGFSLVWLAAYIVDEVTSPDGNALVHTLLGFGLLYRQQGQQLRQQRERHDLAMRQARWVADQQRRQYEQQSGPGGAE